MASHAVSATETTRSGSKKNLHCWSQLPLDLLQLVFERLGFADFERAKTVCSSWRLASKISEPNNQIPWMILFPKGKNYGILFNPEEKEKQYKTQDLGDDFGKSFCVATCRSWLLMLDDRGYIKDVPQYMFYILHLLTREQINLPSFEYGITSPVLWVDEKTQDYLIIGMFGEENAVSFKRGDNSWKIIPYLLGIDECFKMVYEDHKLFCFNYFKLRIHDFSGEIPLEIFRISLRECLPRSVGLGIRPLGSRGLPYLPTIRYNIVVTVRGDVLFVESHRPPRSKKWTFQIYKMDSSKKTKWDKIVSLKDEAILLDLGITVLAKDLEGITRNSIYFNGNLSEEKYQENNIFIYNLDSKKVDRPHKFVFSSVPFVRARWFFPSFKRE